MRYESAPSFERTLRRLDPSRKAHIKRSVEALVAGFEAGKFPHGLGLKSLRHSLWEVRAGLSDRVIFRRTGDVVEFLIAGDHEEIVRFLRRL